MQSSRNLDEKHAHDLTRVNLQFCEKCQRFFVVSYQKNERGELVETGHELDVTITRSGVVKEGEEEASDQSQSISSKRTLQSRDRFQEEGCW